MRLRRSWSYSSEAGVEWWVESAEFWDLGRGSVISCSAVDSWMGTS